MGKSLSKCSFVCNVDEYGMYDLFAGTHQRAAPHKETIEVNRVSLTKLGQSNRRSQESMEILESSHSFRSITD